MVGVRRVFVRSLFLNRSKSIDSPDACAACSCCSSYNPADIDDGGSMTRFTEQLDLIIGAVVLIIPIVFSLPLAVERILYLISYILIGRDIVLNAFKNTIKGRVFDENFLMTIATVGAFAIGEFTEAVAVMLFYRVGEWLQDSIVERSKRSITQLMNIKPDYANLVIGDAVEKVHPSQVAIGDVIMVKPGEKVPLDGVVVRGQSTVDTSALTGEPIPRQVDEGDQVLAGFVNQSGLIYVEATKDFDNSTVAKILELMENSKSRKAPTEKFITKFARYYTPAVVTVAVLIAAVPPLFFDQSFDDWLYRALVFLVISCPCALVISIPVSFFGGLGGASRNGILIKGGQYLEALTNIDTVIFDKTGTLTKGKFEVTKVVSTGGVPEEELLEYAALAESGSNHPIAVSILNAYGKPVNREAVDEYNEIPGYGVIAKVKGRQVLIGTAKLLHRYGIECNVADAVGTIIYVALDGKFSGYFIIADEVREDSARAIKGLKDAGVKRTVMLTGDHSSIGDEIGRRLGIDEVYAELLPQHKVEKLDMIVEERGSKKGKVVFVGDGINDAPVLARADVGVAMGGIGSDAAIEAADVVLMTDHPSRLVNAMEIANSTRRIVWQNIVMALGIKGMVLLLGAAGMATMWEAVFADVGVAVLSVLNAMRIIRKR
ncbi:MAG: cadmium-translocating P-type ATPase [Clostridiales bacterium]|nr:cadmium-translocating P-type ATPase [Clostridiales bacterium]